MKKAKQKSQKKQTTYRPKFADKFFPSKLKKNNNELLQNPNAFTQKMTASSKDLPDPYHPPGSEAYRFPSYLYVVAVVVLLLIIAYILF